MPRTKQPIKERFEQYISYSENGCWDWVGGTSGSGYGMFCIDTTTRKLAAAHRYSFFRVNGYYPKEVDHTCFNKACVNPEHLEDVTHAENMRRADVKYGVRSAKTHCPEGHEYTKENTMYRVERNRRECRTCQRIRSKLYKKRKQLCQTN